MVDSPDSRALLLGLVVGVLVGTLLGGVLASDALEPSPDPSAPPTGYSSSGPSCYDGPSDDTGWLHVVADGETWTATLDAAVVHPPGERVDVDVTRRPTDTYEIAITTAASTTDRSRSEQDCEVATAVNVGTALAEPDFVVTVNGRTIRSVDQDDTVATLYRLENPVNATG